MITVQQIREQIAELEKQRIIICSKPDAQDFKQKQSFINRHINILQDAAEEILRLQRQTSAQAAHIDSMNWNLQCAERNHHDTKKHINRYAHLLKVAGLPPYSLTSRR